MCTIDDFGVPEVLKAADELACKCGSPAECLTEKQASPQPQCDMDSAS